MDPRVPSTDWPIYESEIFNHFERAQESITHIHLVLHCLPCGFLSVIQWWIWAFNSYAITNGRLCYLCLPSNRHLMCNSYSCDNIGQEKTKIQVDWTDLRVRSERTQRWLREDEEFFFGLDLCDFNDSFCWIHSSSHVGENESSSTSFICDATLLQLVLHHEVCYCGLLYQTSSNWDKFGEFFSFLVRIFKKLSKFSGSKKHSKPHHQLHEYFDQNS